MAVRPLPTPEQMRQLLRYDSDTGFLYWKRRGPEWFKPNQIKGCAMDTWNTRYAGKQVTRKTNYGYISLRFMQRAIMAHRAAWCIVYGKWPTSIMDHINGKRDDNRIANLREVNFQQNSRNCSAPSHNTSGVVGVSRHKDSLKWRAIVNVNRKSKHIGSFETKQEAAVAVKAARLRLGFSPRHGTFND